MVGLALVLTVLVANPAAKLKVAAPGLTRINLDEAMGTFYSEHVAQQLKFAGIEVVSQRDISTLLGMERQKQLLGCSDASACMTELANALGADGVLLGDVAKLGNVTQIDLKIIGSGDGSTLAAYSDRVETEEGVLDSLTRAAQLLTEALEVKTGRRVAAAPAQASTARRWSWVPAALGVVFGGIGAVFLVQARAAWGRLDGARPNRDHLTLSEATALRQSGDTSQVIGVAGVAIGAAALAAGAAMFVFGGASSVSVTWGPGQLGVGLAGAWP